jgi:hypothetical protein
MLSCVRVRACVRACVLGRAEVAASHSTIILSNYKLVIQMIRDSHVLLPTHSGSLTISSIWYVRP